ncbi:MAG: peptidoglycan-binding protein [Gammaproteobacteria bacterium]
MSHPELSRGDRGDDVKALQSELNKVGAMLVCDGDFGRGTERAVRYAQDFAGQPCTGTADITLWAWLATQPEPFLPLPSDGVAFIAREETGGLAYYEQVTRWPHYPGAASGITIGVGYDLRFNDADDFHHCWGPLLPAASLAALAEDLGRKGTSTRAKALRTLGVEVPFKAAWRVFIDRTLPRFYDETAAIYPSLPRLPPLCAAVLVSLVFNRGTSLKGASRCEMRNIRDLLVVADDIGLHKQKRRVILADVEDELVAMKRLWSPDSGLIRRRQAEANLWREGLAGW